MEWRQKKQSDASERRSGNNQRGSRVGQIEGSL